VLQQVASPVTDGELALVYTPGYIQAIAAGTLALSAAAQREIGFPWAEAMAERARRSVGATIAACRVALREGLAGNLAGGAHHAYAAKGSGFCVFNDIAVVARLMRVEWACGRGGGMAAPLCVAVIALDVHQGNGTAHIFRRDASVFTQLLHGARHFPSRKEACDLDVELPDGCADDEYLHALEQALDTLNQRFAPGLVLYLACTDPHVGDWLGRLALRHDGLEARDRRVFDWPWQRRVPLAFTMAGGYGRDMADTLQAQLTTWRVAQQYYARWQNVRPLTTAPALQPAQAAQPAGPAPQPRSAYRAFRSISTRWSDNDVCGQ
jgi:acetoin utilization deacetylase AcuC-like enzyme